MRSKKFWFYVRRGLTTSFFLLLGNRRELKFAKGIIKNYYKFCRYLENYLRYHYFLNEFLKDIEFIKKSAHSVVNTYNHFLLLKKSARNGPSLQKWVTEAVITCKIFFFTNQICLWLSGKKSGAIKIYDISRFPFLKNNYLYSFM